MQKQFLDRLDTIDFSREMQTPPNATKRDLVQKKWWNNLRLQIQFLISANNVLNSQLMQKLSMVTDLSSQIGEIHEVYNELTTCAAQMPGIDDPWKSIHSLAVAYKEQGSQASPSTSRATSKFSSGRRRRPWTSRSQSPCS